MIPTRSFADGIAKENPKISHKLLLTSMARCSFLTPSLMHFYHLFPPSNYTWKLSFKNLSACFIARTSASLDCLMPAGPEKVHKSWLSVPFHTPLDNTSRHPQSMLTSLTLANPINVEFHPSPWRRFQKGHSLFFLPTFEFFLNARPMCKSCFK